MNESVVGIIQARMSSERLPGKILAPIVAHRTLLEVLVTRLEPSGIEWWLATTRSPADDVTAAWGEALGLRVFRGDEWDVLSRFVNIINMTGADVVIRVTADNPFTEGATVNKLVSILQSAKNSIMGIRSEASRPQFPVGFIPEAIKATALLRLHESIASPTSVHRTHVTSALSAKQIMPFCDASQPSRPKWRWTVDTMTDLQMAREAFKLFRSEWADIGYSDIVAALDARNDIAELNLFVPQKSLEDG